ncbi:glycoside hydrolase family 30 protein [Patellaria atrata CBS 101060]|uniref:Glycoside hydrolase family 30 protein n=1 Tax=Patellaria atrata CBS 101060 TaxID=1346257 RepID=A0A9P4SF69_9PEZI|nr:glycoside hydrolase family 30 protein [Patellaria atrata CBS 101060]
MRLTDPLTVLTLPLLVTAWPNLVARQAGSQVTVDLSRTFQKVEGFGFAEAFQRAVQLRAISAEKQQQVIDLLFNTTTGAGMTIVRNGIGSSPDSSSDHMVSIQPRNPGGPNAAPKYVWPTGNDDSGQLWFSQQALRYGVKTFYANAWSAPGYMKNNNNDANGGSLCGVNGVSCSSGNWVQAYCNYLVQYVKYYIEAGVPITHLGFLNEPELTTSYASMRSNGRQAADVIKVLRPTLDNNNLSHIIINCCDAEGWNTQSGLANELRSAGVDNLYGVITTHSYTSSPGNPMNSIHPVWQTEAADLQGQWQGAFYQGGGAGEGLTWANNIHQAIVNSNCSAYLYWIGTQTGVTNSKLLNIDKGNVVPSKRLWAFGNWSRFVRPGATRVQVSGAPNGVRSGAFKNVDGTVAVQFINGGGSAANVNVKVNGMTVGSVTAWITNNSNDLAVHPTTFSAGTASGSIPARSMVTFHISPAQESS